MKKILFAAAALLVGAFALTSCSSSSPKTTADKFLTAFYHMEYEEAKKYATDDTKKQLDMMGQLSGMLGDTAKQQAKMAKVDIKDVKEEGDNATVTYTVSSDKEPATGTNTLKLVKQGGKWLAAWNKGDMMGGGAAGAGAATEQPQEMTQDPAMTDSSMMNGTAPMTDTAMTPATR